MVFNFRCMKILFVSDIHSGEDTNYPKFGGEDFVNSYGSLFPRFVPDLQRRIREHDLVVNLGDLIHQVDEKTDEKVYKGAVDFLNQEKKLKSVIGNHDAVYLSREQLAILIGEKNTYYAFDLGGYRHIVLDGFREAWGCPHEIDRKQMEWLQAELKNTDLPVLVYCHYPLDEQNLESSVYFKNCPEEAFIKNKKEVREILEASKKVIAVFNGHLHLSHQMRIHGIDYVTVPSLTENDGNNMPKGECLSVSVEGDRLTFRSVKIGLI